MIRYSSILNKLLLRSFAAASAEVVTAYPLTASWHIRSDKPTVLGNIPASRVEEPCH